MCRRKQAIVRNDYKREVTETNILGTKIFEYLSVNTDVIDKSSAQALLSGYFSSQVFFFCLLLV